MRLRALIHVSGPPGAGKTLLIERILGSASDTLGVARCKLDDSLRQPAESHGCADADLRRYREAGATVVARYRFPASHRDSDSFYSSDFMSEYSDGVLLEGDHPVDLSPDLGVYVAPPPPPGVSLLRRVTVDRTAAHEERLRNTEALLEGPDGIDALCGKLLGLTRPLSVPDEVREKARAGIREALATERAKGPPPPLRRWAIAEGYEGLQHAGLVVLNVREERERLRARHLLPEIARLRKDKEVFDDVIGLRGRRVPITAAAVDLRDERDKELRRILSRIRRTLRDY